MASRVTTPRLATAVGAYVDACDACSLAVHRELRRLSAQVYTTSIDAALGASSFLEIFNAAVDHAVGAKERGWQLADIADETSFVQVRPYWYDLGMSTPNDIRIANGETTLLTGPIQCRKFKFSEFSISFQIN